MTGYVYIWGGQGVYKIGKANNPHARVQQFPLMPYPCDFAHILPTNNPFVLENYLHTHFTNQHIRGEWYELTEQDLQMIPQLAHGAPISTEIQNEVVRSVEAPTTILDIPRMTERLNSLFATVKKTDGTEYSLLDVEAGTEALGNRVTASTLHKLRHGHIRNPGFLSLGVIAAFFQVPITYFYGDSPLTESDQIEFDSLPLSIKRIVIQAGKLDTRERDCLLDIVILFVRYCKKG